MVPIPTPPAEPQDSPNTYVGLDASDHGFRKTTSIEDSFKRWNTPGGEFNPLIITTLTEWMEKVRIANK